MKVCTKCQLEKPETNFFVRDKKEGRMHAQCKDCYTLHRQSHYKDHYARYRDLYIKRAKLRRIQLRAEFRANMLAFLSDKYCEKCGESDIRVLELDHIDPSLKKFTISQAVRLGHSWHDVLKEIRKCRILCANCHKKRTASQYGWYRNIE